MPRRAWCDGTVRDPGNAVVRCDRAGDLGGMPLKEVYRGDAKVARRGLIQRVELILVIFPDLHAANFHRWRHHVVVDRPLYWV